MFPLCTLRGTFSPGNGVVWSDRCCPHPRPCLPLLGCRGRRSRGADNFPPLIRPQLIVRVQRRWWKGPGIGKELTGAHRSAQTGPFVRTGWRGWLGLGGGWPRQELILLQLLSPGFLQPPRVTALGNIALEHRRKFFLQSAQQTELVFRPNLSVW